MHVLPLLTFTFTSCLEVLNLSHDGLIENLKFKYKLSAARARVFIPNDVPEKKKQPDRLLIDDIQIESLPSKKSVCNESQAT